MWAAKLLRNWISFHNIISLVIWTWTWVLILGPLSFALTKCKCLNSFFDNSVVAWAWHVLSIFGNPFRVSSRTGPNSASSSFVFDSFVILIILSWAGIVVVLNFLFRVKRIGCSILSKLILVCIVSWPWLLINFFRY